MPVGVGVFGIKADYFGEGGYCLVKASLIEMLQALIKQLPGYLSG